MTLAIWKFDENHDTKSEVFKQNYENNPEFRIKVRIWQIITAKIFLDPAFEKFYDFFLKDNNFHTSAFLECIWKIDLMLNEDNYRVRYSRFEEKVDHIISILHGNENILHDLKTAILWDRLFLLWRDLKANIDILKDEKKIQEVKIGIQFFIDTEFAALKWELTNLKISRTTGIFAKKVKHALKQK